MKFLPPLRRRLRNAWRIMRFLLLLCCALFVLGGSATPPGGLSSRVHTLTRPIEFDFGTWTLDAFFAKFSTWGLNLQRFIPTESQTDLVLTALDQLKITQTLNAEILAIYTDPAVNDPQAASQDLREELASAESRLEALMPLAESILQAQLMDVIEEAGLDVFGQVLPPSLFQFSDVPQSLILSPRTEISKVIDISLTGELSVDEMEALEAQIFDEMEYAALVVGIGGIGTYPTMVMETTDLVWLAETIAHEWTHNYLTLRPLGINYDTNADLRTINETTASLVGEELGLMVLEKYYPEFVPEDAETSQGEDSAADDEKSLEEEGFDYHAEMRSTRVEVDRLLSVGEVEAAEEYMELRRQDFWENGYAIRKINQAYFAFYGAYDDDPSGGAAGDDPVGPAVLAFRGRFNELADFLNAISWVDSFEDLIDLLEE